MNKLLATSALVAAGLVASTGVASAQSAAPAPIQVVVGGYMIQYFGTASNSDNVNYASGSGRATGSGVIGKMNNTSQQSDAEIWFGGRTTLSNGIVVGFDVQLEGNSNNYQGAQNGSGTGGVSAGDTIDESYLFIDGAFGRAIIGSENGASYLMHYGAPAPGATSQWGANEFGSSWIHAPVNVSFLNSTLASQTGDNQKLTYFTPRWSGLQFGGSFMPNSLEDQNGFTDMRAVRNNVWEAAANYVNKIGDFNVAASYGMSQAPSVDGASTTLATGHSITDQSVGLQVGTGPITVGGAYRNVHNPNGASDGHVWAAGVGYQAGPIALTVSYLQSDAKGIARSGNDTVKQTILGGAYNLGPGVDAIAAIVNQSYKDEEGRAADQNSGTAGIVGLRLFF